MRVWLNGGTEEKKRKAKAKAKEKEKNRKQVGYNATKCVELNESNRNDDRR